VFVTYSVCVVRYRSLRPADLSSRGVLLTVVCERDQVKIKTTSTPTVSR
jgi:hypothetical protein